MQEKSELSNDSPLIKIQSKTTQDLSNPNLADKAFFNSQSDVHKLLYHVVNGNHDAVQWMLKKDISLIYKKDTIIDSSKRFFNPISAFEYTAWSLDEHMWITMLDCIPKNEEGNKILKILSSQYDKVSTEGVTYKLNEKVIIEKHFDFKNTIIKELKTQISLMNTRNWDAMDMQWRNRVAAAQKLLPMYVVHEYCSDEPFDSTSQFKSRPKSSQQIYNWINEKNENWFGIDSNWAGNCAIYKGSFGRRAEADRCIPWPLGGKCWTNILFAASDDLAALKNLCKTRTMGFINLKSQLEELISVNNQPQPF